MDDQFYVNIAIKQFYNIFWDEKDLTFGGN